MTARTGSNKAQSFLLQLILDGHHDLSVAECGDGGGGGGSERSRGEVALYRGNSNERTPARTCMQLKQKKGKGEDYDDRKRKSRVYCLRCEFRVTT